MHPHWRLWELIIGSFALKHLCQLQWHMTTNKELASLANVAFWMVQRSMIWIRSTRNQQPEADCVFCVLISTMMIERNNTKIVVNQTLEIRIHHVVFVNCYIATTMLQRSICYAMPFISFIFIKGKKQTKKTQEEQRSRRIFFSRWKGRTVM